MGHAMFSIKDFSDFTGLPETTLRYYDKIGLLSPALRGENRYRYYAPYQIIMVDFIKVLTMLGVPLSTIRELRKARAPQTVLALLEQQQSVLNMRLRELQESYSILQAYRSNIQAGMHAGEQDMCIRDLDETRFVLGPRNDFGAGETFYKGFIDFCNQAHENRINLLYPVGGYHEDINLFARAPGQPNRFFSLDPSGSDGRTAGQYLVAHATGYYGNFGDTAQRMLAYAREHGLMLCGPVYSIYLLDEISMADPDLYVSQVTVRVTKAGQSAGAGRGKVPAAADPSK